MLSQRPGEAAPPASVGRAVVPVVGSMGLSTGTEPALGSGTQMRGGDQLSHSLVVVVVSGEERGGVGWGVSTVIPVSVHLSVS